MPDNKHQAKRIVVSYWPIFTPVMRKFVKYGFEIISLSPQYSDQLKAVDIPSIPLNQFANGLQDGATAWAGHVIGSLPDVLDKSCNGAHPDAVQWLRQLAYPFYYPRLVDMAMVALALDQIKPDLCLLHNDVEPTNRVMALWCKANSVPCIHSPHAVYQDINRTPPGTDIHDVITASHIAAAGPFQRQWYELRGKAVIMETGLPQTDTWATRKLFDQKRARKALGLDPNGPPVVTYFTTWAQHTNLLGVNDEWQRTYISFLEAIKGQGIQVIVKCHFRSDKNNWSWHAKQAQDMGVNCIVTPQHLEQVIDASDVYLAYGGSNSILDASFTPWVRLLSTHGYDDDLAVIRCPMDIEGMRQAIFTALSQPPRSTVALRAKYLGDCDGRAHERIAEWGRELCV